MQKRHFDGNVSSISKMRDGSHDFSLGNGIDKDDGGGDYEKCGFVM